MTTTLSSPQNFKALLKANATDYRRMVQLAPEAAELGVITYSDANILVNTSKVAYHMAPTNPHYENLISQMHDVIDG